MVILDRMTGEARHLRWQSVNDDDWYLYDRENDMVLEQHSPQYKIDHTQTPRGLEWLRGMKLKHLAREA